MYQVRKHHIIPLLLLMLLSSTACLAQQKVTNRATTDATQPDSLQRFNYHVSLFSGVYSGWGETHGYMGVAPSFSYTFNDHWKLKAGFMALSDLNPNFTPQERSLAPRRNTTTVLAGAVRAEYQANDHLWFAASAFYVGGQLNPVWVPGNSAYTLQAYGVSTSMRYKTKHNNYLDLSMTYIHDNTGVLAPLLCDPYYSYGNGFYHTQLRGGFGSFGGFNDF